MRSTTFIIPTLIALGLCACESRATKDARVAYYRNDYKTAISLLESDIQAHGATNVTARLLLRAKWEYADKLRDEGKILQAAAQFDGSDQYIDTLKDNEAPRAEWFKNKISIMREQSKTASDVLDASGTSDPLAAMRSLIGISKLVFGESRYLQEMARCREDVFKNYMDATGSAIATDNVAEARRISDATFPVDPDRNITNYLTPDQAKGVERRIRDISEIERAGSIIQDAVRNRSDLSEFSVILKLVLATEIAPDYPTAKLALNKEWDRLDAIIDRSTVEDRRSLLQDATEYRRSKYLDERGKLALLKIAVKSSDWYRDIARRAKDANLYALRFAALKQLELLGELGQKLDAEDTEFLSSTDRAGSNDHRFRLYVKMCDSSLIKPTMPELLPAAMKRTNGVRGLVSTRDEGDANVTIDCSELKTEVGLPDERDRHEQKSRYLLRTDVLPNPRYEALRDEAQSIRLDIAQLDTRYQIAAARPLQPGEYVNAEALGLAMRRNHRIDDYNGIMGQLNATPQTISQPVYQNYLYTEWPQRLFFSLRGKVTIKQGSQSSLVDVDIHDSRECTVIEGVRADDAQGLSNRPSTLPNRDAFLASASKQLIDLLGSTTAATMRSAIKRPANNEDFKAIDQEIVDSWYLSSPLSLPDLLFISDVAVPSAFAHTNAEAMPTFMFPSDVPSSPLSSAAVYKTDVPGIAFIVSDLHEGTSCGTGFFLSEQGLVITNAHVVGDAKSVAVRGTYVDGSTFGLAGSVISEDPDKDIALVYVEGLERPIRPLSLRKSGGVEAGIDVVVIGNPGVAEGISLNNITKGIVSNPRLELPGLGALILIDAAVNPGNSGGPAIDLSTGEVIGMVTFAFDRVPQYRQRVHEGQGGVIPADGLWKFITEHVKSGDAGSQVGKP